MGAFVVGSPAALILGILSNVNAEDPLLPDWPRMGDIGADG